LTLRIGPLPGISRMQLKLSPNLASYERAT
jgi:hypothetical protein